MELYLPLILDGATGTELQKHGYRGDVAAEQWVLNHPDAILEIQRGYADAGSDILYSPTFGGNRVKLEENRIFNRTEEINEQLALLSKEASAGRTLVAGDLAPTGLFTVPLGDATFDELVEIYSEQIEGLERAGVDLYVIETMMTVSDARAALTAVRSRTDKPVIVSFTCDENGKTITGSDAEAALVILQSMGASVFGLNCSVGPEDLIPTFRRLRRYARVPLAAKPNAGKPELVDGKTVYRCEPEQFAACVSAYAASGVQLFGGCCGTDARFIRVLRDKVMKVKMVPPDPQSTDKLICATEKHVFEIDPAAACGRILEPGTGFAEALEKENASPEPFISVRLRTPEDTELLTDEIYTLEKPLCIVCDDSDVLERMLKAYNGRALYEGSVPENILSIMRDRYGLIT
jgi:5-methyltetrahydrofolate--homocysteine methyltransferase